MIDKVQKIREEVARIQLYTQSGVLKQILDFIDSLQEEPKPKFKIGDKVVSESGKYAEIESIDTDKYWCKGENGMSIPFKYQDKWELVEEPVSEVWHDAWKEEPEKGRNILVKDANTNCCFVSSFEGRKSWEDTYQGYAFRLWAYIDDLLKI